MKLVFSKKGFDTEVSPRHASLILPDGRLLSLPIPEPKGSPDGVGIPYEQIHAFDDLSVGDVLDQLGYDSPQRARGAHLDPDLSAGAVVRPPGWRPLFGTDSTSRSASHLAKQGVGEGDLFLFHGRFRETGFARDGRLRYLRGAPVRQLVFGYLQVGECWRPQTSAAASLLPTWAQSHPHVRHAARRDNVVFVGADRLLGTNLPGAAAFASFDDGLVLTEPGRTPAHWQLPACFAGLPITYCQPAQEDGLVRLRAPGRGQEFVVECTDAVREWAVVMTTRAASKGLR